MLRLCSYNVEWFNRLFDKGANTMKPGADERARFEAIRDVLKTVDADLIGVVEAPNTLKNQTESTVERLKNFATWAEIRASECMMGHISSGMQELAILYDPDKLSVRHDPGGGTKTSPRFDDVFYFDTDEDRIVEQYKFFRPPLEAEVTGANGAPLFHLILAHPKSKGIFDSMDVVHLERESQRNRRKLLAECTWIRRRVEDWLDDGRRVVVMGDVNDGPGMDEYEFQFGRSAVEVIMGDLFSPDRILRSYTGKPRWGRYGWKPASARYRDRITEDPVDVLIDHILVSGDIPVAGPEAHKIWNPYEDPDAKRIRNELKKASDHFPVTLDVG